MFVCYKVDAFQDQGRAIHYTPTAARDAQTGYDAKTRLAEAMFTRLLNGMKRRGTFAGALDHVPGMDRKLQPDGSELRTHQGSSVGVLLDKTRVTLMFGGLDGRGLGFAVMSDLFFARFGYGMPQWSFADDDRMEGVAWCDTHRGNGLLVRVETVQIDPLLAGRHQIGARVELEHVKAV